MPEVNKSEYLKLNTQVNHKWTEFYVNLSIEHYEESWNSNKNDVKNVLNFSTVIGTRIVLKAYIILWEDAGFVNLWSENEQNF